MCTAQENQKIKQAKNLWRSCLSWTKANICCLMKPTGTKGGIWHTWPYKVIQCHWGLYCTIRYHTGQYRFIESHTGPCKTIGNHRKPHMNIKDHRGAYGAIKGHTWLYSTIHDYARSYVTLGWPFKIIIDHGEPNKTIWDPIQDNYVLVPFRKMRDCTEPYGTISHNSPYLTIHDHT